MPDEPLMQRAAAAIYHAFDAFDREFKTITRKAKRHFEARDWAGSLADASERLMLYRRFVDQTHLAIAALLAEHTAEAPLWTEIKRAYSHLVAELADVELAETFFNSLTRRIFFTVGVDPAVEYVNFGVGRAPRPAAEPIWRTYPLEGATHQVVRAVLTDLGFAVPYRDLDGDARLVARAIETEVLLRREGGADPRLCLEVLPSAFYRNKGAYVVGRIRRGREIIPLVLPLLNTERGITVDAVLLSSDEASVVFGFSWSYFHVEVERPRALIEFLRSIMPLKRIDELYNSVGFNKHGKTELYRTLLRHLERPDARFELAEGDKGLVMTVFTLPSLDVVFKIIKDRFQQPKNTTRQAVMAKYHLVFVRDRVGRLADAQEFEHLVFGRSRFSEPLLQELLAVAPGTVSVEGDRVIVKHLYTERRVTPLNLFIRTADRGAARDAIIDYGHAIKDLAAANIFPGDMLLKNFGVSRHGRVIFYDYDELCLLTECNFREIPQATSYEDEIAAEPWYHVGERDVFPEEFQSFVVLPGDLGEAFGRHHRDLFDVRFWREMQDRQAAGEVVSVFPYRPHRRLRKDSG